MKDKLSVLQDPCKEIQRWWPSLRIWPSSFRKQRPPGRLLARSKWNFWGKDMHDSRKPSKTEFSEVARNHIEHLLKLTKYTNHPVQPKRPADYVPIKCPSSQTTCRKISLKRRGRRTTPGQALGRLLLTPAWIWKETKVQVKISLSNKICL